MEEDGDEEEDVDGDQKDGREGDKASWVGMSCVILLTLTITKIVWTVQAEAEEKERQQRASVQKSLELAEEIKARKEAMRREAGLAPEK